MKLARTLSWALLAPLLLTACGGAVTAPLPSPAPTGANADTPTAVPTPVIETAPELAFLFAEPRSDADGAAIIITGLYHVFDRVNRQVDVCHAQGAQSTCLRYPLDRELGADPMVITVKGTWQGAKVAITDWQALPLDWADATASCSRTFKEQADRLAQIDWAVPALPAYRDTSAAFKLDAAALNAFTFAPAGFDPDQQQFILRGEGPLLPEQSPLVKRWSLLYCIGNRNDLRITHIVATIEGFAEEH
jgi:hypothetical protein